MEDDKTPQSLIQHHGEFDWNLFSPRQLYRRVYLQKTLFMWIDVLILY